MPFTKALLPHLNPRTILLKRCHFTVRDNIFVQAKEVIDTIIEPVSDRRRLFKVVVEAVQNMFKHSAPCLSSVCREAPFAFMISLTGETYNVSTLNALNNTLIAPLEYRLAEINSLGNENLKRLYSRLLMENQFNENGDAGLGLLQMARLSGTKLKHLFRPLTAHQTFFYLNVAVTPNQYLAGIPEN